MSMDNQATDVLCLARIAPDEAAWDEAFYAVTRIRVVRVQRIRHHPQAYS